MTRDNILQNSIWTEAKLNVYSSFFQKEVKLQLFTSDFNLENTQSIISERFVETVNDFISLSEKDKPLMKSLLYRHCLACSEQISYGFELLDGETEQQANLREFGVSDEESVFEKANLDHVAIQEDEFFAHRFVRIIFYPEWDSHGCELILKNGNLLDYYGEGDTYFGQFDD
ncbi:MAG: hypothetical protein V4594_12405 [Bacteroidota bacterium]